MCVAPCLLQDQRKRICAHSYLRLCASDKSFKAEHRAASIAYYGIVAAVALLVCEPTLPLPARAAAYEPTPPANLIESAAAPESSHAMPLGGPMPLSEFKSAQNVQNGPSWQVWAGFLAGEGLYTLPGFCCCPSRVLSACSVYSLSYKITNVGSKVVKGVIE